MPAWVVRSGLVVAVLLGAYLTFEFGRIQAGYNVADAFAERQALTWEIEQLEAAIEAQKEQIALLETHRNIDRAAYKDVEASLGEFQRKIQEQRDAIEFYRGIISPADGGRGLRVQDVKLVKTNEEGVYSLRVVLVQVKQHDQTVKGEVDFTVEGEQDGAARTFTLAELLPENEDSSWPFSFRYFQDFERQLIMPSGFQPQRINIEVNSRTKSVESVKQSYLWQMSQS
ncbi:hypothetical protein BA177_03400 [Woeseia oceani]|uniref:Uncharacterized protein n=1 Tax=Woeseia oceani TaxID=1548547 RepID=A0A193LD69_9GAMM|nr:hypothetical protein BA177_03400 [Woeseia oceani]